MAEVEDTDRGLNRITAHIKELGDYSIAIGFMSNDTVDGVSVVDYAIWNEFGTERIPARPFLSRTYDQEQEDLVKFAMFLAGDLIDGKKTPRDVLKILGLHYQAKVQNTIRDAKQWAVPNAPSTVEAKGSSSPLIDTGRMIGAVRYEIRKN